MNKNSERLLRTELEELLEAHKDKLSVSSRIMARYLMECIDSINNLRELIRREEKTNE